MKISFGQSQQSTIGIEWELAVVDATTLEQVPGAQACLRHVADPVDGPIRGEYLDSMIELVSSVHSSVPAALAQMQDLLETALGYLEPQGLTLLGAGAHPFGEPTQQVPICKPQYLRVAERNGWWGRQMAINGLHLHTGIDHRDKALPIVYGLARFTPYFIALTASSPFWAGEDTQFASQRTMMFQQLPTNGLPYPFDSWSEFESFASQLEEVGMIHNPSEIRWDVRPSSWGTVENRVMDSVPTLFEIGALTALGQCLTERMSQALEHGEPIDQLPHWFLRENKWRAARYGLDAQLITPRKDQYLLAAHAGIKQWVDALLPIAEQLGCAEQLLHVVDLVDNGPSYLRQRKVVAAGGTLHDVAQLVVDELHAGKPAFEESV